MAIKEPVQPAVGLAAISQLLDSADTRARDLGYPDASLQGAYHRQILMLLAQAYVQVFGTSIENPDWVPHTSQCAAGRRRTTRARAGGAHFPVSITASVVT